MPDNMKLPWPIRLTALVVAVGMSLYVVEIYAFGGRMGNLIGVYLKPAPQSASRPSAPPSEPGVVPVNIVGKLKS